MPLVPARPAPRPPPLRPVAPSLRWGPATAPSRPPRLPPTSPGVPRGLGWAPPVGGPRSWGRGGWPGGVRPRESAWPGGAARPPLPSPFLAGPPLPAPPPAGGGLRCGPADAAGRGPPRPPTRPLSSASSSSPPPPATSSFLSGTLTSPSGDSGPFPKVNPFGGGGGTGAGGGPGRRSRGDAVGGCWERRKDAGGTVEADERDAQEGQSRGDTKGDGAGHEWGKETDGTGDGDRQNRG